MIFWKKKIFQHRFLLLVLLFCFLFRFINLTNLPIFNDEAIYLDWGWNYTHMPGHLYDSLLDAKQPLLLWIFGLSESIFQNPLFAGRIVSVFIGIITALGIYFLTKKLLNNQTALIASLLYAITPIFLFYDRQALMESAIACIGIWSCFSLLNIIEKPNTQKGMLLGLILGLGFLLKSSSLIFIASSLLILLWQILKERNSKLVHAFFVAMVTGICVNILLFINPIFWQTFSSNSRYSYTVSELFSFPLKSWVSHLFATFEIAFIFTTPFIFMESIVGIYILLKKREKKYIIFLLYFFIALFAEVFATRIQSQRYLVPFLVFLVITASIAIYSLCSKGIMKRFIAIISILIPLIVSLFVVFSPQKYIIEFSKISRFSDTGYVFGQTSGYGIIETMQYIEAHSSNSSPSLVFFGLNAGNPESAVDLYSQKIPQLFPLHIDSKLFSGLSAYDCFSSKYPVFLVTRNNQLLGLDRYFDLEASFSNPDPTYFVRIYTIKKNCKGNTVSLSNLYKSAIEKELQFK